MSEAPIVSRDATLSPCGLYRYTLARRWASGTFDKYDGSGRPRRFVPGHNLGVTRG